MDIVLLDAAHRRVGVAPKLATHHESTPLHLAFSCHIFNAEGKVLITRRALSKKAWPGVWTNSFCGHPQPEESFKQAIIRHALHELGVHLTEIKVLLPDFSYRATDPQGIVENEVCPVYTAVLTTDLTPNPGEVMDWQWADPQDIGQSLKTTPWAFSPWFVWQAEQLDFYQVKEPSDV